MRDKTSHQRRQIPSTLRITLPGIVSAGGIVMFILGALFSLWLAAPNLNIAQIWQDPYLRYVTQFSFKQATLSTLLSLLIALPLAEALARRRFVGRQLLLKLFSLTFVLPVLVAVFGLLAIYGKSGLINAWLGSDISIYGLSGILLAHVFFNAPLSTRMLLQSIESTPIQQQRLAIHLGLNRWQRFKLLSWPRVRQQIPHIIGLVFMLCFTSFGTVMALGGGPQATTIELAIYQAIRFDFDLGFGALLAIWQMLICAGLVLFINRFSRDVPSEPAQGYSIPYRDDSLLQRGWDGIWIILGVVLVIPPFIAVITAGLNGQTIATLSAPPLWSAMKNSLLIAFGASLIAMVLALFILNASRHWRIQSQARKSNQQKANLIELCGSLILVTPGLVISTGLFLMVRQIGHVFSHAFILVILVNALMAMPFILKTLAQPLLQCAQQYTPLSESLGLHGWQRWHLVEWRLITSAFIHAFCLAFVLSLGDLTAIAMFGSQQFQTLPMYLFQLMGSYQMDAAATVALVLLALSLSLFILVEKQLVKR